MSSLAHAAAVDEWFARHVLAPDDGLERARDLARSAELPDIAVSPLLGRMLELLVRILRARRVLEIGTLGGYSAIAMARALPAGGRLVTLELDPTHARVARAAIEAAGLSGVAEVCEGRALDLLPALQVGPPFDMAFIDADKPSNPEYLDWALRLVRPGGVIVVDNVVREGRVLDSSGGDAAVEGVRRMMERVATEPRLRATMLQSVGLKGHDGLLLAWVCE